jgi:hypothetical protein
VGQPELDKTVVVAGGSRLAAYLRAHVAGLEGRSYPLSRAAEVIVVGTDRECSWMIGDGRLAPRHLRIEWDGVTLAVEPLARDPQVFLDQQPIAGEKRAMRPHQRLTVGATTITLELVFDSAEGTVIVPEDRTVVEKTVVQPQEITEKIARRLIHAVGRTPPGRRMRPRYQPPRNAASAADPTREWALADAQRPVADVFGRINRTNLRWLARRWRKLRWKPWLLALACALATLGALVTRQALRPGPAQAVRPRVAERPARAPAPIEPLPAEPLVTVEESAGLRLRRAIDAYRAGRFQEAREAFEKLAGDPAARLVVWILDHRDPRDAP